MNIGVFQFAGSGDLDANRAKILKAISSASALHVRLLVFQECAVCGYPPLEVPDIESLDFDKIERVIADIQIAAEEHDVYIAVGTIRRMKRVCYNSICFISPDGTLDYYDKIALWGWDLDHFREGTNPGIFQIDNMKVAFRICYDIRFPELFRACFLENVNLCFVSFCDIAEQDSPDRYNIISGHLSTRAAENVMTVVSVNSISKYQTAPSAVFDYNGKKILEAVRNQEGLLTYDFTVPELTFGMKGRIENSKRLMKNKI
jgi:omega-amidase